MNDNQSNDALDPNDFTDKSPSPGHDLDLAILSDLLLEKGVTVVVIQYSGYGDSGGIDSVEYEPANVLLPPGFEHKLREIVEDYFPEGYENNDGGSGTLTLYPVEGLADLEHANRYEDSTEMDTDAVELPKALRLQLAQQGIQRVTLRFDGYGDSGQFEDVAVEPEGIESDLRLMNELENVLLEALPGGWEINAGSFGTFIVDVEEGSIESDAYWREEKDTDVERTRWKWRP